MSSVLVRGATSRDVDSLLGLFTQLAEDRPESQPVLRPTAAAVLAAIFTQAGRTLLVATVDEQVVGTADLLVVPNLTHHGRAWAVVENMVVDHQWRRVGVGQTLMKEIIHRCREAGCYKIQLLSRKHRHAAHAFYQRLGFQSSAEGFRLYLV